MAAAFSVYRTQHTVEIAITRAGGRRKLRNRYNHFRRIGIRAG